MSAKEQPSSNTNSLHAGLPSVAPSNDVNIDSTLYEETRDGFILGFNVVREISEATDLLSPLKAAGLLMVRGLEITKVCISCHLMTRVYGE
jgi:hypothetical protein